MIEVYQADYQNADHRLSILELIDLYARDKMGQGSPLRREVYERLVDDLMRRPWIRIYFAANKQEMIGIAVCMEGFSTFNSAPLANIHDVYVKPGFRRQGVAHKLFAFIEHHARGMGFCKLTLEVLGGNLPAQETYRKMGFEPYTINDDAGVAQFWQKHLP